MVATPSDFLNIKTDERFGPVLTLARALNVLRFCQIANLSAPSNDTPSARRQRVNSVFFISAALHETYRVVKRVGKHFKDRESWKTGFGPILRDQDHRRLRETVLPRMRNKSVFHFDDDVAEETLPSLTFEEFVFVVGVGEERHEVYYELADTVAINFLLAGLEEWGESEDEKMANLIRGVGKLAIQTLAAGDKLMVDILPEMGWGMQQQPENQQA